jgi:hypothetical protein
MLIPGSIICITCPTVIYRSQFPCTNQFDETAMLSFLQEILHKDNKIKISVKYLRCIVCVLYNDLRIE